MLNLNLNQKEQTNTENLNPSKIDVGLNLLTAEKHMKEPFEFSS